MSQASSLTRQTTRWRVLLNTLIVMLGTLLSRALGVVRTSIFSRQFGTSPEFGAFQATFSILDILYLVIIGGALGSALIPVFSRLMEEDEADRGWELANTILTLAFGAFVVVALVVGLLARPLLALTVARGYADNPYLLDLAVRLLRLMLIQPLLLGLGGIMMALLQSFERFTLPAIAFNVYNLAIITAALVLVPRYTAPADRVESLAWGVIGGAFLYLLVQTPGVVRAGLRFRPSLNWRMAEVRRVGVLLAPRLVGQSALQINIIVMLGLIGLLSAAAQAAYSYAYLLLMLPHGIIALSLGTVMFPRLARLYAANQIAELRDTSLQTLRLVLWLTVPAAVMLAVLHVPVLRLLYQGGQFTSQSLALTARVLLFFTPGAIGLAGAEIVIRTFYAMEDTRTPVIVGVATIALNAVLAWSLITFVRPDVGLVTLSYSLTNLLEFAILFGLLLRRLTGSYMRSLLRSFATMAASTGALWLALIGMVRLAEPYVPGVTFASAYGRGNDFFLLAGWLALAGCVGGLVYVGVSALLRAPEIRELRLFVRRRAASTAEPGP